MRYMHIIDWLMLGLIVAFVIALSYAKCSAEELPDFPVAAFESRKCDAGMVIWQDAIIYTHQEGIKDVESLMPRITTFGCISQTARQIVVMFSFIGDANVMGTPTQFLLIPKEWVMIVKVLEPPKEAKNAK